MWKEFVRPVSLTRSRYARSAHKKNLTIDLFNFSTLWVHINFLINGPIKREQQNLARQRASHFAQEDPLDSSTSNFGSHSHTLHSTPSSVVVTTLSNIDFDKDNWQNDEDFLTKPRGYFADQFEVKRSFYCGILRPILSHLLRLSILVRTEATMKHISKEQALKFGDKRVGELMPSSLVQVNYINFSTIFHLI